MSFDVLITKHIKKYCYTVVSAYIIIKLHPLAFGKIDNYVCAVDTNVVVRPLRGASVNALALQYTT